MLSENPFSVLERRLNRIEAYQAETLQILRSAPLSPSLAEETHISSRKADILIADDDRPISPDITRKLVVQIVRSYVHKHQNKIDYKTVWNLLYQKLHDGFRFNAALERQSPKESYLDVVERCGQLDHLHWLAEKYLTEE